jgi:hypothetical protein
MERVGNTLFFTEEQDIPSDEILEHFPAVPLPVIEALERLYPDRLPSDHITERALDRKIGQQDVIKTLRQVAGQRT